VNLWRTQDQTQWPEKLLILFSIDNSIANISLYALRCSKLNFLPLKSLFALKPENFAFSMQIARFQRLSNLISWWFPCYCFLTSKWGKIMATGFKFGVDLTENLILYSFCLWKYEKLFDTALTSQSAQQQDKISLNFYSTWDIYLWLVLEISFC